MSVTYQNADVRSPSHGDLANRHPQLAPFIVAAAIATVSILVSLAFIGLPA